MTVDVADADLAEPVFEVVGRVDPRGITWAWTGCDLVRRSAARAAAELSGLVGADDPPNVLLVYLGNERFVDLEGLRVLDDAAVELAGRGGTLVVVAPPRCLCVMVDLVGDEVALLLAADARQAVKWLRERGRTGCRPRC